MDKYKDSDGFINEFSLMWDMKDSFPLHFFVFKQCASHICHEANVEQIFSLAKKLSDPNLDPNNLATMVRIAYNQKFYMPPVKDILAMYLQKYGKAGAQGEGMTHDDSDQQESDVDVDE